jgi:hypothetical protein
LQKMGLKCVTYHQNRVKMKEKSEWKFETITLPRLNANIKIIYARVYNMTKE